MTRRIIPTSDRRENRTNLRVNRPEIQVTVGEKVYSVLDWSLGGIRTPLEEEFKMGDQIRITHIVSNEGEKISVDIKAAVVRVDPVKGELGVKFIDMPDHAFSILEIAMIRKVFRPLRPKAYA